MELDTTAGDTLQCSNHGAGLNTVCYCCIATECFACLGFGTGGRSMKHSPEFVQLVEAARRHIEEVGIDDVRRMLEAGEDFLLIDVREESEWQLGHLPRAQHLCKGIIERDIGNVCPDRNRRIVLYCGGGYRSALAAENLQRMGYTRVASMWGGWRAWIEAGYPTEL